MKKKLYCSFSCFIVLGYLLICSALFSQEEDKWIIEAKTFLAAHPENKGLGFLIQAVEKMNIEAYLSHSKDMDNIIRTGWKGQNQKLQELLTSQSPAMEAAAQAGQAAPFSLPPYKDVDSPVPSFSKMQGIAKMMSTDARRLESAGMVDQAADRAVQAAFFGDVFCAKEQSLISYLIGLASLKIFFISLESILCHPGLSIQAAQKIGGRLFELDKKHIGISVILRNEFRPSLSGLKVFRDIEDDLESKDSTIQKLLHNDEVDYQKVWDAIIANMEKPYWERKNIDAAFIREQISNQFVEKFVQNINFREAATRADYAIAHLRLCEALCALKLQKKDLLAQFQDPFTGRPLVLAPDRIYSLGPDMIDQKGALLYDPTNGTVSPGDIAVLALPK